MRRLFVLLICLSASGHALAGGEVAPSAAHEIVLAELSAMKLPANSPICLAILPPHSTSETGTDPSPQLLRYLARKGMRPRKASVCYRPLPKGNVISIEVIAETADRLSIRVDFSDVTITADKDLGVVYRLGVYELIKDASGKWVIQSYASNSPK